MLTMDSLCKCGHSLEDHHNSIICDGMMWDKETEKEIPFDPAIHKRGYHTSMRSSWYCLEKRTDFPHAHGEECEFYGFNETGGMLPLNQEGACLEWVVDSEGNRHMNEPVHKWINHCNHFELR